MIQINVFQFMCNFDLSCLVLYVKCTGFVIDMEKAYNRSPGTQMMYDLIGRAVPCHRMIVHNSIMCT